MLIFAAILAIFVYGMTAALLGTILPDLSERFHLTPRQNGAIAAAQAIGLMIASLGVGPLLDSQGDKIGLILGLIAIAVALFALPRATGFGSIVLELFLLGIGGGIVVTGANALAGAAASGHRAIALNLVNLFFGLGGFATPFISAHVFKQKWTSVSYTVAAFALVTLAVHAVTPMPGPAAGSGFVLAQASAIFAQPLLLLLGLFLFLYVACEVGIWNWLTRHLIAQGLPESKALNILSFGFALGLLLGRVAVSPILIHVSPVQVTLWAAVAIALTTFLMLRATKPVTAAILVFLAGVAMAPVFPTTLAIVGSSFPHFTATATGFAITCGWAGLALSSPIIGGIAGPDPKRLKKALLILPAFALVMVAVNLAIQGAAK
ncbi:MAG TPA: MFS transporter [Terracidiphilus sp.]|nr:MFS transporter [Terracidiphilus sp.]